MDADTRHQLKQNELAEAIEKLRDFNNPTTRNTLLLIGAVIVLLVAWSAWKANAKAGRELTTQQLGALYEASMRGSMESRDQVVTDLQKFITETSDKDLAGCARVMLARVLHDEALLKVDKRDSLLKEATGTLKPYVEDKDAAPMVQAAAMFALATCYESQRDFDAAEALLKRLGEPMYKGSPYAEQATILLESSAEIRKQVRFTPGDAPRPTPAAPPVPVGPVAPTAPVDPTASINTPSTPPEPVDSTPIAVPTMDDEETTEESPPETPETPVEPAPAEPVAEPAPEPETPAATGNAGE